MASRMFSENPEISLTPHHPMNVVFLFDVFGLFVFFRISLPRTLPRNSCTFVVFFLRFCARAVAWRALSHWPLLCTSQPRKSHARISTRSPDRKHPHTSAAHRHPRFVRTTVRPTAHAHAASLVVSIAPGTSADRAPATL